MCIINGFQNSQNETRCLIPKLMPVNALALRGINKFAYDFLWHGQRVACHLSWDQLQRQEPTLVTPILKMPDS